MKKTISSMLILAISAVLILAGCTREVKTIDDLNFYVDSIELDAQIDADEPSFALNVPPNTPVEYMNLKVSGIAYDGSPVDLLGDKTMQRGKSLMFNTLNNIKTANIRLEVI